MNIIAAVLLATHIGFAAVDLDTGHTAMRNQDDRFPMGSVYKLPIAMTILRKVDRGEFKLDQKVTIEPKDFAAGFSPIRDNAHGKPVTMTIAEMIDAVVRVSDNTPSDWVLVSREGAALLAKEIRARSPRPPGLKPVSRPWTDDYSNIVQILK